MLAHLLENIYYAAILSPFLSECAVSHQLYPSIYATDWCASSSILSPRNEGHTVSLPASGYRFSLTNLGRFNCAREPFVSSDN